MAIILAQNERIYAQVTHPYAATIPNSTGTATLAAGDYIPHIKAELPGFGAQTIRSAAKTGALGRLAGVQGRSGGERVRLQIPFQMSGVAGTVPDMDQILAGLMGQAATVNAGTSVVYSLSDAIPGVTVWSFRTAGGSATNVAQRCAWGTVLDEFEISTVDGELVMSVSGPCSFCLPSIGFASFSSAQKASLTAFPSEPASPVATGNIIPGFIATISINGVSSFQAESFSVRGRFNRTLRYSMSTRLPTIPLAGVRELAVSFRLFEENVSAMNTMRDLQRAGTPVDINVVFGDTAGYIATFALNGVVLNSEKLDDSGQEYILSMDENIASMTNATTKDELVITLT